MYKYSKHKQRNTVVCDEWLGVNYTDDMCGINTATESVNFVKSKKGGIEKRKGIKADPIEYTDAVYGVHIYTDGADEIRLVHSGTNLYCGNAVICADMAQSRSKSVQYGKYLFITDGERFVCYDGDSVKPMGENPYIPLIYTHRKPAGGGERAESPNIFTALVREGFISDGQSTQYVLSRTGLVSDSVSCTVYRDDGTSYTVTNGDGLSVNTAAGIVTFSSAPPLSRATDRDNVIITYTSNAKTDVSVLNKCRRIFAFGEGGSKSRLFLSGNEYYPGVIWYSQPGNPMYFGSDCIIDTHTADVTAFSTRGDRLFAHANLSDSRGCIAVIAADGGGFKVINVTEGECTFADTVATPGAEPMFLTKGGVYAIEKNSATLENFTLKRGGGLDGRLGEIDFNSACAAAFKGAYILAAGRDMYVLKDNLLWRLNFPINISMLFREDGSLKMVSDDGKIYGFGADRTDFENTPVQAVWRTGRLFSNNINVHKITLWAKTLNRGEIAVCLSGDRYSSVIKFTPSDFSYFSFEKLIFSTLNFSVFSPSRAVTKGVNLRGTHSLYFEILSESGGCEIKRLSADISEVK